MERIAVMMGGRAAEEVIFSEVTTGAANDFDQATMVARSMVVEYGMSDLGPINYGPTMDITEWGKNYMQENRVSEEMMGKIDGEVKRIITNAYATAIKIIKDNRKLMDKIAEALLKKEGLDQEEFEEIIKLKKPVK